MNFIKKIKDGNNDGEVHLQFQKYSKGEFKNKAMISAKFQTNKYRINTTPEFGNELVKTVARKVADKKVKVTGAIVTTRDLTGDIEFKDKKQFQGVKRYIIEKEVTGNNILELVNNFPKAFFGLSFSTSDDETQLKIKPKAPKSGKPGKGEETPKVNFCRLITKDKELAKSFIFEVNEFKEANITHTLVIDELEIPEESKKSGDFKKMREDALRIGKIIREAKIDGKDYKEEISLKA